MTEAKKKKKKKTQYPFYGSVFAPIFPTHSTTPTTTPSPSGSPGMTSGGGAVSGATDGASMMGDSISRRRALHDLRVSLGLNETADPTWVGYGMPNPMAVAMRQGGPNPVGPGFQPVEPGQGGKYDFQKSPGLGFRSEAAWKVWAAVVEIMPRMPTATVSALLQAGMQRAGVKFGDIESAELRLLEMGIEWYLSDPGKFPQSKDSDGGPAGGIGANQLTPGVV